jgi:hypothetical protein
MKVQKGLLTFRSLTNRGRLANMWQEGLGQTEVNFVTQSQASLKK